MTNYDYEWERLYHNREPTKNIEDWNSRYGYRVTSRNSKGFSEDVEFTLLIDNPKTKVYIVGEFNKWGEENLEEFKLEQDDFALFSKIKLKEVKHKDKYKFLIIDGRDKSFIEDPAATYFDDEGNCVFWDFEDPTSYKQKYNLINTFDRPTKIIQTDLPGLIVHHKDKTGKLGSDVKEKNYYKFIAQSGIVKKIKDLGFNTIQFLPFAQSIDGSNWKFRYLVPFQFAIQKNWGNPDEFKMMIDEFHKEGIAVIGDFVLGHIPHKDFKIFNQISNDHGIHLWRTKEYKLLYLKEETSWGTMRINFDNHYVREFFISSTIHFLKNYRIDGFRIDNVDGIIRHGSTGEGPERQNGRTFLRELNETIYSYNPCAMINYEAHYFFEDNAKLLVAPIESDKKALGSSAYNSSRLTYYFHTEYMFKGADEISTWKFKHISEEKEWGKSNSTVADFHNHDAAAGLMPMRCTGSYAYDSMKRISPEFHVIGKLKVMEAIIAFTTEGKILDLLQTFLLQEGTFEHDSSIQWNLIENNENSKKVVNFKKEINKILEYESFWPINTKNREYLNVDDKNKILVVQRSNGKNENLIVVINISSNEVHNYKVGLKDKDNYEVIFDSDINLFSGTSSTKYSKEFQNVESNNFELLNREIELPIVAPYGVVVLRKIIK